VGKLHMMKVPEDVYRACRKYRATTTEERCAASLGIGMTALGTIYSGAGFIRNDVVGRARARLTELGYLPANDSTPPEAA
jgi:hypothetical protein